MRLVYLGLVSLLSWTGAALANGGGYSFGVTFTGAVAPFQAAGTEKVRILEEKLDVQLLQIAQPALTNGELVRADLTVRNVDRTVGTILGHHVTKATSGLGLPENTIDLTLRGTAGQSWPACSRAPP